jgi:hypothetical protein
MAHERNEKNLLQAYLKELHLPTVRASFEELARKAQQEGLSYERYLLELVQREIQDRRSGRIAWLLRQSQLPPEKSWPALDLKRLPPKVLQQARLLLEGEYSVIIELNLPSYRAEQAKKAKQRGSNGETKGKGVESDQAVAGPGAAGSAPPRSASGPGAEG